jgi:hypothetical protein
MGERFKMHQVKFEVRMHARRWIRNYGKLSLKLDQIILLVLDF